MVHTSSIQHRCRFCRCVFVVTASLLVCAGCSAGDDPATVTLAKKLISPRLIHTAKDENETERIVSMGIKIDANNRTEARKLMARLGKLERLVSLWIGGDGLTNGDLESLPPLPDLKRFSINTSPGTLSNFTDEGLKYIADMKGLRELSLLRSRVRGPGLAYLKGFDQLESLCLSGTPLDDSGIPHIVKNFPKLRRLEFGGTNVTAAGLMQLADLHWLEYVEPSDAVFKIASDDPAQPKASKAILLKFDKAHLASKRKARAAGIDVPYDSLPFSSPELAEEIGRQVAERRRAKERAVWREKMEQSKERE